MDIYHTCKYALFSKECSPGPSFTPSLADQAHLFYFWESTFKNIPKIYQSILNYTKIYQNIPKICSFYKNILDNSLHKNIPKISWINFNFCENIPKNYLLQKIYRSPLCPPFKPKIHPPLIFLKFDKYDIYLIL